MAAGIKIGIVNSSTFGRYFPDLMDRLETIGEVERYEFDPDISGQKLAQELQGVKYIIASVTPDFTDEFFEEIEGLSLIARHGIGCDNVDIEAAADKGVAVTRVLGLHERDAVAELALALMMNCLRQIVPAAAAVEENRWDKRRQFVGRELSKMKAGIIGYGNIGSRTAEIIKEGFGCEVMAYDPNVADAVIAKNGIKPVRLHEVIENADIISIHASSNPDNYHFIGEDEFEMMKDDVIIVNTARGELMDERALAQAVKSDKIGAVGLDVSEKEPIPDDHPLLGLENVYIVPHIGGYTDYSLRKMDEKMVVDVEKMVEGEEPELVINPEVFRKNA